MNGLSDTSRRSTVSIETCECRNAPIRAFSFRYGEDTILHQMFATGFSEQLKTGLTKIRGT